MIKPSSELRRMKLLFFVFLFTSISIFAQTNSLQNKKYMIFPDEYSELDDIKTPIYTTDEYVLEVLNSARKTYIQAIILSTKKDTLGAEKYFKISLDIINSLASYPDIMTNTDFTDLAIQIMDDYGKLADKGDLIDANSPLFLIKEKIFSEMIAEEDIIVGDLITLKDKKVASTGVGQTYLPTYLTIPMPENDVVKKSIKWFTETKFGRKVFESWYSKSTRWFPLMKQIAKEEGVPEEIVYLSMIESGLNPTIVSRASAVGLWQFMYPTGKDFGLNSSSSIWVDERRDPEKSTRAAMKYLKYLHKEFGDWHVALAAYNCGQGRVGRAIKRSGKTNPTFWEISHLLPKETRYYVPKFISTALVAMEPHLYNFQVDTFNYHDEYKFDIIMLNEPVSVSALSKCLNITDSVIYALNPELLRSTTPPNAVNYRLKIPHQTKDIFATNFALLTPEEKQPYVEHSISSGETIAKIARKYDISAQEIVELNGLKSTRTRLKRGNPLKLPISVASYEEINQIADESGSYYPLDGSIDLVHYVSRGESLYRIARKYGVSIDYLVDLNGLRSKNSTLNIGQKLIVSLKEEADEDSDEDEDIAETGSTNVNPKLDRAIVVNHRVKYGESISEIASMYETDADKIKKDNRLKGNSLRSGTNLRIVTLVNPESLKNNERVNEKQIAFHYVRRGETLGRIASKYDMSVSDIQRENSLRGSKIYPGQKLKIQKTLGGNSNNEVNVASISKPTNSESNIQVHSVNKGESLYNISKRYNISVSDLKSMNNLSSDYIYQGQKLKLIDNGTLPSKSNNFTNHKVRRGETLGQIAENYGVLAQEIRNWNNIKGSRIYPGQKLLIQSDNVNITKSSTPKKLEYHTIRKGETLSSIASRYDVSVNDIKSWNNISGVNIKAGERLALNADMMSKGSNSAKNESSNPIYYNLKKGENLAIVASKFGISVDQIQKLNSNVNPRRLQIGQKIRVK